MAINISARNFELTDAIQQYIHTKISTLNRYAVELIDVDVEVSKNMHHRKGPVFHVRWNVQVPHDYFRAEAEMEDLYAAIDTVRDEMDRELLRRKTRWETKRRRVGRVARALKEMWSR